MRLKEPQLADLFGGDAAGREVGHAARLELDAYVGDVDLRREHRKANSAHLFDGGLRQ